MPARRLPGSTGPDACPGALRPHTAADGLLIRVRLPGGLLDPGQLRALAAIAESHGDAHLELTSRANLQLRALAQSSLTEVADGLTEYGLLPSASHERVRNIIASPLSGRAGRGRWDVRPVVSRLDRALLADPALAALSGRFLFALDDGGGDVLPLGADISLFPAAAGELALLLAGEDVGVHVAAEDAVPLLIQAAQAFLAERAAQGSSAWRLAELTAGPARVRARVLRAMRGRCRSDLGPVPLPQPPGAPPIGLLRETGGGHAVGAVVPLGRLSVTQATCLAELAATGRGEIVVTPWRTVVVGGLSHRGAAAALEELTGRGLPVDAGSPWLGTHACAGKPKCAKALADVRADAREVVRRTALATPGRRPVHWAGCERQCGKPAGPVTEIVATGDGYAVDTGDGEARLHSLLDIPSVLAEAPGNNP